MTFPFRGPNVNVGVAADLRRCEKTDVNLAAGWAVDVVVTIYLLRSAEEEVVLVRTSAEMSYSLRSRSLDLG